VPGVNIVADSSTVMKLFSRHARATENYRSNVGPTFQKYSRTQYDICRSVLSCSRSGMQVNVGLFIFIFLTARVLDINIPPVTFERQNRAACGPWGCKNRPVPGRFYTRCGTCPNLAVVFGSPFYVVEPVPWGSASVLIL